MGIDSDEELERDQASPVKPADLVGVAVSVRSPVILILRLLFYYVLHPGVARDCTQKFYRAAGGRRVQALCRRHGLLVREPETYRTDRHSAKRRRRALAPSPQR
jgi:hypothetical protein